MSPIKHFAQMSFRMAIAIPLVASVVLFAAEAKNEAKIAKKDVPPAVMTAFEAAHPKAAKMEVEKKTENGTVSYEIEFKDSTKECEILYSADGTVIESHTSEKVESLPVLVSDSVKAAFPQGKITKVEKVLRGAITEYEVDVAVNKKNAEVLLDETGKILSKKEHQKHKEAGEKEEK